MDALFDVASKCQVVDDDYFSCCDAEVSMKEESWKTLCRV